MKQEDIEKYEKLEEEIVDRAQLIIDTFYPQKTIVGGISNFRIDWNTNQKFIEFDGTWLGPSEHKTIEVNDKTYLYTNNKMMFKNDIEFICEVPYDFFTMEKSALKNQNKEKLKITLFNNTEYPDEEFFK